MKQTCYYTNQQYTTLATMVNNPPTRLLRNSLPQRSNIPNVQQQRSSVWQDKPRPPHDRIATPQPAPQKTMMRPQRMSTPHYRSQKRPTAKRKTVHLSLWVKPVVKTELQRIAEQEGLSVSTTGSAFLEQAIQQDIHTQHSAMLDTIIAKAIATHMRSYSTRIALLLVRVAFASEQTRSISTNILNKLPGVTQAMVSEILTRSSDTAKRNITRKTPQLESISAEVEQWMREEGIPHE